MHALMISLDRALTNPQSDAYRRHRALADRVESLTIVVPTRTHNPSIIHDGTLKVIQVHAPTPLYWFRMIGAARHAASSVDVIITQDMFVSGLIGWRLRAALKKPLLVQSHSAVFDNPAWLAESPLKRWGLHRLAGWVMRRADFIRTVNAHDRQALIRRGFPADRIDVLALGTASAAFAHPDPDTIQALKTRLDIAADDKIILWVGYPVPFKRVNLLIDMLAQVTAHEPKARLLMVGVKPDQAAALNVHISANQQVMILPPVPHTELPAYYAIAHVYTLTSSYEGLPRVLFEAGAAGLAAVGFDVPGVNEVITADTGRIVPEGDIAAFAAAVVELLHDQELSHRLGENARAIALSHYDADGYPDRWAAIWRHAAEKGLR